MIISSPTAHPLTSCARVNVVAPADKLAVNFDQVGWITLPKIDKKPSYKANTLAPYNGSYLSVS